MIRFGMIGTNFITERFIDAARQTEGLELAAVYSRTESRAREFAGRYGIGLTFTDLDEMAASDRIDAVYIASPNSLHAQQAVLFLSKGIHVLCEKPLASNTGEIQEMFAAAEAGGAVLMEAVKTTLLPSFSLLRENLHKIGPIRRYFANYGQYSSRYDAYKEGTVLNAFRPEFSNGALMDLGLYCIYPLVLLFGRPEEVKASAYMLESGVDGEGSLIARYAEMDAVVTFSKITDSHVPSEIQGELGSILIDKISEPRSVQIRYRDGSTEDLSEPAGKPVMSYEIQEFVDVVRSGRTESSVNSRDCSLAAAEVMEEARRQFGLAFPADQKYSKI
ncbi:Gfo/Idh/MocA family oxidoreductase [Saccharibacillus sp. CPCC 101409]|uniref:Gfo/Idh/MocA family protein n=1 Tax=Saccharibacillus sp. CPCC 101409 TaxID=3058041 RepID=UPI0026732201|nr:Gfo/Idh/MocA family oxidoreductase [Saccharibacillus sp. CPCC 101409]MDO3408714.1 Gfo/Idh/MocA family oxidoreductase [Saccharibacillus sp. CPCC 101409]